MCGVAPGAACSVLAPRARRASFLSNSTQLQLDSVKCAAQQQEVSAFELSTALADRSQLQHPVGPVRQNHQSLVRTKKVLARISRAQKVNSQFTPLTLLYITQPKALLQCVMVMQKGRRDKNGT